MKTTKIVYPKTLTSLESKLTGDYGVKLVLKPDESPFGYEQEFDAALTRSVSLNTLNQILYWRMKRGRIGGVLNSKIDPPQGGLLPSSLVEPFEFYYQIDSNEETQYIGQSGDAVKEYWQFQLYDGAELSTLDFRNLFMFTHNQDLLLVGESIETVDGMTGCFPSLFKYNETLQRFERVTTLSYPIDNREILSDNQIGSCCGHSDGKTIFIYYRICERSSQSNRIIVFKTDDYLDFQRIAEVEIQNEKALEYTDFRLRSSYGDETHCFVMCGVGTITITEPDGTPIYTSALADMRSYTSFDGGFSYYTYNDTVTNLIVNDAKEVESSFGSSSMAAMFIPIYVRGKDEEYYQNMGVNFALYYDRDMASFVILKAGDPEGLGTERSYLVGAKTSSKNPMVWEPCLNYQLVRDVTGEINQDVEDPLGSLIDGGFYKIQDISVSSAGPFQYLIIECARDTNSESGNNPSNSGVFVSQFKFVANQDMPRGNHDKILAYGTKTHPDYTFVSTIADLDTQGLVHAGDWPSSLMNYGNNPISTYWRNQLVATARFDANSDEYSFLAIHAPWTNLGEYHKYESSFTRYIGLNVSYADWGETIVNGGTITYDTPNKAIKLDAPVLTDFAYLEFGSLGNSPNGNVMERCDLSGFPFFKAKFQIAFDVPLNDGLVFFEGKTLNDTGGYGYGLRMWVNADGSLFAETYSGAISFGNIGAISDFDNGVEFFVSIGLIRNSQVGLCIWKREFSNYWQETYKLWEPMFIYENLPTDSSTDPAFLKIGIVDYTTNPGYSVRLGDIGVSSFGSGFKPTFAKSEVIGFLETDPAALYNISFGSTEEYTSKMSRQFDYTVVLRDGDVIKLDGGQVSQIRPMAYSLLYDAYLNTPLNTVDNVCSKVWDMNVGYVAGVYRQAYYELEDRGGIDALCLFNTKGLTSVNVTKGNYDETFDLWSDQVLESFDLDYVSLSISDYDDHLIEIDDLYGENDLNNHYIMVYNNVSLQYEDMYLIVRTFEGVLQLNKPFLSGSDFDYRLFSPDHYIALTEPFQSNNERYMSVEFVTIDAPESYEVGQTVAGNALTIDDITSSEEVSYESNESLLDSEFGLVHRTNAKQEYHYKVVSFDSPYISPYSDNPNHYLSMFKSLYYRNKPLSIVQQGEETGLTMYFGFLQGASLGPDKYFTSSSFSIAAQTY